MLYSTGLVAGGSLTGVAIALLSGIPISEMVAGVSKEVSLMTYLQDRVGVRAWWESIGGWADLMGTAMFIILALFLVRTAMKKD